MDELWQAWLEGGERTLASHMVVMNAEDPEPLGLGELDVIFHSAVRWFQTIESDMEEQADRKIDQQVAEARYGFFLD